MSRSKVKIASRATLFVIVLAFATALTAETIKIEGFIKARSGDEMIVEVNEFAEQAFKVDPKYTPQLTVLAEKAKDINGYMIDVIGYVSAVGSQALNQQLSEDRADKVTNILIQQGHIPLTIMLAPGAHGRDSPTRQRRDGEGQAENRRVMLRVLQNKAIAGV